MLPRVLEPEVMDTAAEARDYDAMDHAEVNRVFVADFLSFWTGEGLLVDLGTGTAQIPIELCRQHVSVQIVAVDMAEHMLQLAKKNVHDAGFADRIQLQRCDAKKLPWPDGFFAGVISNSIVHHIPEPGQVLAEMVRVVAGGGAVFVRDLLRPNDDDAVKQLVQLYAGAASPHQQQMFDDSLRAALRLDEIRALVSALGFARETVTQTTDRHWTWAATRPG
jgi:ubiquinone/menaquinone biosynthesis C-methylase UbiE